MTTDLACAGPVAVGDATQVASEAAGGIARSLREALAASGRASIALSGGNTPRGAYRSLAREAGIDWANVGVFWVDERAVPPDSDRSNYRLAMETLLDDAHVSPGNVHRMRAEMDDPEAAARDYERVLREHLQVDGDGVPSFDVVVLGVGDDGHTASLFPGELTVDVSDRPVAAVPARGAREARLTLTPPSIEHARHVFVLVTGAGKRQALERVWGPTGSPRETPARIILRCRGTVTWIVDNAAAGDQAR